MTRRLLTSQKGLTLAELLGSLAIFSLLAVIIIGYLVTSMNSFRRVNEEIALHDEANYVMSEFVNYIFVATEVVPYEPAEPKEPIVPSECMSLIKVKDYYGKETILGFLNNKAVKISQNEETKEFTELTALSTFNFYCTNPDDSKIGLENVDKDTVKIMMLIQDGESKYQKKIQLKSVVSFIKVD
jgi:hypothetical protein